MEEMEAEMNVEEVELDEADMAPDAGDAASEARERQRAMEHPLHNIPDPAPGAQAACFIPGDHNMTFVLGDEIKAVGVLSNGGSSVFHVWGAMGSLNNAETFGTYLQNFSYAFVNRTLLPGEETSFLYAFSPYERLEAKSYRVAITVFYEDMGAAQSAHSSRTMKFANTVLNETIELVESAGGVDNTLFYTVLFTLIAGVIGGMAAYKFVFANMRKSSRGGSATETGTQDVADSEWIDEHLKMKGAPTTAAPSAAAASGEE